MDDFPSNSQSRQRPRREEQQAVVAPKKVDKVVEGVVVQRKKPLGKRMREIFLGGDNRSVLEFVIQDVIVPNIRDMVFEAGQQGLERSLYGESQSFRRGIGPRPGDPRRTTNYNGVTRGGPRDRSNDRQMSQRARATHDFGELVISSRPEAEAVLDGMFEYLNNYEVVPVSVLYELAGVSGQFTDNRWGWTDLRSTTVRRVRDGWLLDLPRPEAID